MPSLMINETHRGELLFCLHEVESRKVREHQKVLDLAWGLATAGLAVSRASPKTGIPTEKPEKDILHTSSPSHRLDKSALLCFAAASHDTTLMKAGKSS